VRRCCQELSSTQDPCFCYLRICYGPLFVGFKPPLGNSVATTWSVTDPQVDHIGLIRDKQTSSSYCISKGRGFPGFCDGISVCEYTKPISSEEPSLKKTYHCQRGMLEVTQALRKISLTCHRADVSRSQFDKIKEVYEKRVRIRESKT